MIARAKWRAAVLVGLVGAWACKDAANVELLQISGTGVLFGQAFLDLNGNGIIGAGDVPLTGVSVVLTAAGKPDAVQEAETDSIGLFILEDVPVGTYTLGLDSAVLGDSLTTLGSGGPVAVALGDTTRLDLGASYPRLTLEEVRAATPGKRVFTSGVALNARQPFSDGEVYFKGMFGGAAAYLRMTNVERASLATGDSVRLLGRTALDNGQPTLDAVTPLVLISQAQIPVPVEVTTAVASTANGGPLDAALVRIRTAEIADTSTTPNGDFHFWAHNGGDSVEVVFRSFLSVSTTSVRPDTVVRINQAIGLLSPFDDGAGNVRWRLLPRGGSDVVLENKVADVGVTAAFDTDSASVGDTVEIRVTVRNLGPQTATGVPVADTIPAALTFLSVTATKGSYDETSGTWSVGDLLAGAAADTLRISAEVTGGTGTVINTARVGRLQQQIEPSGDSNDAASAGLTIS